MIWDWIKSWFSSREATKSTAVSSTPKGKLWATIASGKCPDCDGIEGFYEGPSGGMSTNIQCIACKAWFNVTPLIGIAERIKK